MGTIRKIKDGSLSGLTAHRFSPLVLCSFEAETFFFSRVLSKIKLHVRDLCGEGINCVKEIKTRNLNFVLRWLCREHPLLAF